MAEAKNVIANIESTILFTVTLYFSLKFEKIKFWFVIKLSLQTCSLFNQIL